MTKSNGGSTSYYDLPEGATQLQDLIEDKKMGFSLGNIFKACYRMGEKHGQDALYDINKIKWFIHRIEKEVMNELKSNKGQRDLFEYDGSRSGSGNVPSASSTSTGHGCPTAGFLAGAGKTPTSRDSSNL